MRSVDRNSILGARKWSAHILHPQYLKSIIIVHQFDYARLSVHTYSIDKRGWYVCFDSFLMRKSFRSLFGTI